MIGHVEDPAQALELAERATGRPRIAGSTTGFPGRTTRTSCEPGTSDSDVEAELGALTSSPAQQTAGACSRGVSGFHCCSLTDDVSRLRLCSLTSAAQLSNDLASASARSADNHNEPCGTSSSGPANPSSESPLALRHPTERNDAPCCSRRRHPGTGHHRRSPPHAATTGSPPHPLASTASSPKERHPAMSCSSSRVALPERSTRVHGCPALLAFVVTTGPPPELGRRPLTCAN